MDIKPKIFTAKVMHKRLFPRHNVFTYSVYYLALPLPTTQIRGMLSCFYPKDIGKRDGSDPYIFAQEVLVKYDFFDVIDNIILVTMPRVMGYVFNPVSFYFCLGKNNMLFAVLAEVHNTFGEQHTYFCAHANHSPIMQDEWLETKKLFHVSPFLPRNGYYKFRFALDNDSIKIWIQYFDKKNKKQLITSLIGNISPLHTTSLTKSFWRNPGITIKTIFLIHWQAIKLMAKRIPYIPKPPQYSFRVSTTREFMEK